MIQVEIHNRSNALVQTLSGAKNAAYHSVLAPTNSEGAGSFLIHRADPMVATLNILQGGIDGYIVHLLRKGPLEATFTDRFAFVVEAVSLGLGSGEEQSDWITVAGRGTLCLLEDRIAMPPGYDGVNQSSQTSQWQAYVGAPGGSIMAGEIDRSNPRFGLALTHSQDSGTAYQQPVLADAPSGWWRLGDAVPTTGPTIAKDLGSAGNPGTLTGGVTVGVPGALSPDPDTAMTFDGASGFISMGSPQLGVATWSLEAWLNPAVFSGTFNMVPFINGTGAANGYGIAIGGAAGTGGTHLLAIFQGSGWIDSGYAFPMPNRWYHIVITYDNTNLRFYVNGAIQATVAHAAPTAPTGGAFIGQDIANRYFNGKIDEVAIYPTTLALARIQAHYNAGSTYYQPVSKTTVPQTVQLRFDNLLLLHYYLVGNGMEAQMVGTDYQAADHIGTDKSASVVIRLSGQDSLLAVGLQRDVRPIKNYVVAQGTGEGVNALLRSSIDAASVGTFRRREGFLSAVQDSAVAQVALRASSAVAQLKVANQRITVKFSDSSTTQLYRDFGLGDTVGLSVLPLNWAANYRVVGIQVADTDAEIEDVSLDLNDVRQEYLLRLATGAALTAQGLNVIGRMPQGGPFNDSAEIQENCTPTFPGHFDIFIPSNVLQLNYAKLSFFLRAFRRDVASINTVTSGASSAASSAGSSTTTTTSTPHGHNIIAANAAAGANLTLFGGGILNVVGGGVFGTDGTTGGHTHDLVHTHNIPHTHDVTPTLQDGIFEGAVATGVTVNINGTDRTSALGGGAGFTTTQTELEVGQWLNIGAWNTIDLTPTGLGRISAHLRLTGYIQSN